MKELTHQNYPNHIDQDGKPIVGSEWGCIYDNRIKRIVTGLGDIKLFIKVILWCPTIYQNKKNISIIKSNLFKKNNVKLEKSRILEK